MQNTERNRYEQDGWILEPFTNCEAANQFDCGNSDLNEFFRCSLASYHKELLSRTYTLTHEELDEPPSYPIALICYCNDKVRLDTIRDKLDLSDEKSYPGEFPAVKIARLGVSKDLRLTGIGTQLLNMTKSFFLTENRTGCRILTVNAYRDEGVTSFYRKNGFDFLTTKVKDSDRTITMFYDLIRTEI